MRTSLCGDYVQGLPPIIVTMDSSKLWDVLMKHATMDGRMGTSRPTSGGCSIAFS